MLMLCMHCKTELLLEITARSLVSCPACEFLFAASPGGQAEVPTFAEEDELGRITARQALASSDRTYTDVTMAGHFGESLGDLDVPRGKLLYVETLESPTASIPVGTIFRFSKGRMILGRADADIRLDDSKVSKKHAAIEAISRENIYLRDLASTNGTFLNEHQVATAKLRDGDVVRLGPFALRFHIQDQ